MKECWFRVHTSILDSPKFERLSLAARGLWVSIGALVKERGDYQGRLIRRDGSPLTVERLAREIGYPVQEVDACLRELIEAGLIEQDGDYLRMHDWEEWQVREDQRVEWREQKRKQKQERNGSEQKNEQPSQVSNEFRDFPEPSETFLDVPQHSKPFREVPVKIENKTKSKTETEKESENKTARSAYNAHGASFQPQDAEFVQGKYRQHGLSPPAGKQLALEAEALRAIEAEYHAGRRDISRAIDHVMQVYRGDSVRRNGAAFRTLKKHWHKVLKALATKEARQRREVLAPYHQVIFVPSEWGGLQ